MELSERQLEIVNILKEQGDIPESVIFDVVKMVENPIDIPQAPNSDKETELKIKILEEKDWRKRAQLAALLISKSLE